MWAKGLPRHMLKLSIRVSGCLDRLEIHCRDIRTSEVRGWINLQPLLQTSYHLFKSSQPISPETAAKNNCFAPGNEEKETPGRPCFDIIDEILEELRAFWDSGPVSRKYRLETGYKMLARYKRQTADCTLGTKWRLIRLFFRQIRDNKSFYPVLRNRFFLLIFDEILPVSLYSLFFFLSKHQDHVCS